MSAQENKEFIRKYLDAINWKAKPATLIDQYIEEQPLRDHIAGAEAAFPEYGIEVEQMVAEDDLVSVIGRVRGTHKGPLMGIPATGKSFDVPLHITYRVKDGKITEHWMLMDNAALMQQLGLIPSAA